jgi:hypothetical protein
MKKKHLCSFKYCRKKRQKRDPLCPKHRHRYNKENNPVSYTYNLLKSNAKRRGKVFELTLEQFKDFCNSTGYIAGKGKQATSLSIDRVDVTKGYTIDNLQILTLRENSVKRQEEDYPF